MLPLGVSELQGHFPAGVGLGICRAPDADWGTLFPAERAILGPRVADLRRRHFTMGRMAAHTALSALGAVPTPIGKADDGAPLWPAGIVGAITHTGDISAAVVGWARELIGLGLDFELRDSALSEGAAVRICLPDELDWARASSSGFDDAARLRVLRLFSAKEAVFKAVYPVDRVWLGFHDVAITAPIDGAPWIAKLLKVAAPRLPLGAHIAVDAWLSEADGLVCSSVAIPDGVC